MKTIKEHREKRGWTQDELAKHSTLSKSMIAQIESSKKPITKKTAVKLAEALGVDPGPLYMNSAGFSVQSGALDSKVLAIALTVILQAAKNLEVDLPAPRLASLVVAIYPMAFRQVMEGSITSADDFGQISETTDALVRLAIETDRMQ